jgi:lipoprotein-anchoring transpeptidase ErfK/SrfK
MIMGALAAFALTAVPHAAIAATAAEQALVLKKKAEEARKLELKKKQAAAAKRAAEQKKVASRRDCGTFLECLFGKPRPPSGVQRASLTSAKSVGVDRATSEVVSWNEASKYSPGSIIVKTPERALYLVMDDGKARRYKVGVGREGFQWSGNSKIVSKQEWPTWRPPATMIKREAAKGHYLPEMMEGGPENPLGARALYIGGTLFRIHGTNNAASIGGAVSSGCIRMMNTDVVDLYDRVKVGARVYVYQ